MAEGEYRWGDRWQRARREALVLWKALGPCSCKTKHPRPSWKCSDYRLANRVERALQARGLPGMLVGVTMILHEESGRPRDRFKVFLQVRRLMRRDGISQSEAIRRVCKATPGLSPEAVKQSVVRTRRELDFHRLRRRLRQSEADLAFRDDLP